MAVSDLTGTTWLINEEPAGISKGNTYSIQFTTNNYNCLNLSLDEGLIYSYYEGGYYGMITALQYHSKTETYIWEDQAYRTITITGGTDVTNSYLIAWLEANATQVTNANNYDLSYNLTNLTNGNVSLTFVADTGYALPSSITVSNGTLVSWNQSTGVAVISGYNNNTSVSVECNEEANGYSGSIVCESNEGAYSYNTYIKFDNAPTSGSDYDAYSYAYNGDGYVYGSSSYSGKTKVYAWGNNLSYLKVGNTTYVLKYETGMALMPRGYDNPLEITLTENATITLGCGSSSGGGSDI